MSHENKCLKEMLQTSWGYKGDTKDGPASHDTWENQLYPIDITDDLDAIWNIGAKVNDCP